jgi:hypothetical protein
MVETAKTEATDERALSGDHLNIRESEKASLKSSWRSVTTAPT